MGRVCIGRTGARNRRCTLLRAKNKYGLCATHATEERQLREAESVARELLGDTTELNTATSLNHVLGKLFALIAANRIPERNAAVLAYIGQLLLYSIDNVRDEIRKGEGDEAWEGAVRNALEALKT